MSDGVLCKEAVDFNCLKLLVVFERCLVEAIVSAANGYICTHGFTCTQGFICTRALQSDPNATKSHPLFTWLL